MKKTVKLGISACLLGEKVRYDGGHKLDPFLTGTLGEFVDYVPVCPEVECGLGVPREAMRLTGSPEAPRLLSVTTQKDYTGRMIKWARKRVVELEKENLCGFIFKSRSPSSGMERVKVYREDGAAVKQGVGVFAKVFMDRFPLLPVEDEGRLQDPLLRENFIERVFAFRRWREVSAEKRSRGRLVSFHSAHKLLLLAHSPRQYRALGNMVARAKELPLEGLYEAYGQTFMEALRLKATIPKNANVLQHMMGYFKKALSGDEKQELLEIIESYRQGHVPLIVPITLMNHYVRKYDQPYLKEQAYLHPHPLELKLRNHA